jgi:hypothetical protein
VEAVARGLLSWLEHHDATLDSGFAARGARNDGYNCQSQHANALRSSINQVGLRVVEAEIGKARAETRLARSLAGRRLRGVYRSETPPVRLSPDVLQCPEMMAQRPYRLAG